MPFSHITLLVEDLEALARALPETLRFPALEFLLARGRRKSLSPGSANHVRFQLFDMDPPDAIPVAALTEAARLGEHPGSGYWLRADPVGLRADMTRVFIVSSGMGGYGREERAEAHRTIGDTFETEGISFSGPEGGPWCLRLERSPGVEFVPLNEALGVDMAGILPSGPASAPWKRLMTDVQVELHQSEVNRARRERGDPEINGIWFWGGGSAPETVPRRFDAVASGDPVTRGLAVVSGCPVFDPGEVPEGDGTLLVDWTMQSADARREAEALDRYAAKRLEAVRAGLTRLELVSGSGHTWAVDRHSRYRFWRAARPLASALNTGETT